MRLIKAELNSLKRNVIASLKNSED